MSQAIAVDKPFLAQCLGLPEWPADVPLDTVFDQMAARAITDAHRPPYKNNRENLAKSAIINTHEWIKEAYEMGVCAGKRCEREQWEQKITTMFGFTRQK